MNNKKCSEIFDCINGNCNNCIENDNIPLDILLKSSNIYIPLKSN